MSINEQPSIDQEIEDDYWDVSNSPFFADIDPSMPVTPIGFTIPRPHRPLMDPEVTRNTIAHLKKRMELSKPVQAI